MPSASSVHVINSDDEDLEPSSDNSLPANKKRIEQRRSHREEESRSPTPSRRSDRRPSPSKKVQETLRDEALGKKVAKRKISDATSQSKPQKIIKSSQATAPVRKRTPQPKKNPANKDHARRSTTTVNRENTASQSYCAKKLTGNSQSTTYTTQLGGGLEFEDFQDATGDNGNNMDNEEVAPPVKVKIAKPKLKSKAHTAKEKELAEKIQREQNELFEDDENEYVDEDKADLVDQELKRLENGGEAEIDAQHEDFGETPDQELARLKLVAQSGAFKGLTLDQLEDRDDNPDLDARPHRGYFRQTYKQIALNIRPRIKRLEDLTRMVFLATWDMQTCMNLVPHVFPEFMNDIKSAWILELGAKRVRQNCTQWKSRSIAGVKILMETDATNALLNAETLATARAVLSKNWSEADFYDAFAFTANKIDITKSSTRAKWYIKSAFVNLAAYAKFVVAIKIGKSVYKEEFSHKTLLKR